MYGSYDMRHVDFRGLTGSQRTPGFGASQIEIGQISPICFGSQPE